MTTWTILSYESGGKPGEDGFWESGYAVGQAGTLAVCWEWRVRATDQPVPVIEGDGEIRVSCAHLHDALSCRTDWRPPTRAELYRRLALMFGEERYGVLMMVGNGDRTIPFGIRMGDGRWVYAPSAEAAAAWWEGER